MTAKYTLDVVCPTHEKFAQVTRAGVAYCGGCFESKLDWTIKNQLTPKQAAEKASGSLVEFADGMGLAVKKVGEAMKPAAESMKQIVEAFGKFAPPEPNANGDVFDPVAWEAASKKFITKHAGKVITHEDGSKTVYGPVTGQDEKKIMQLAEMGTMGYKAAVAKYGAKLIDGQWWKAVDDAVPLEASTVALPPGLPTLKDILPFVTGSSSIGAKAQLEEPSLADGGVDVATLFPESTLLDDEGEEPYQND